MSFYLSKILWFVFNPFNVLFFLTFFSILFLFFKKKYLTFLSLFLLIFSFISFAIFPLGKYLFYILEKNYHAPFIYPDKVDGILIIGGATDPFLTDQFNQIHLNSSSERLLESIILIKKYTDAKIIFSGGSGYINNLKLDHAKVAKQFYKKMGLNTDKIIFENRSRNTYENILNSKNIV